MTNELQMLILEQQVDALNKPQHHLDIVSLEDAGLEEDTRVEPIFGHTYARLESVYGGVIEYVDWFSDNDDSRWEQN